MASKTLLIVYSYIVSFSWWTFINNKSNSSGDIYYSATGPHHYNTDADDTTEVV